MSPSERAPGDALVAAVAIGCFLAAVAARHGAPAPPVWIAFLCVVLCAARRWPRAVSAAIVALALALGARAEAALDRPVAARSIHEWVTLVRDPEPSGPSTQIEVRVGSVRAEANVYGALSRSIAPRLMGDRLLVHGRLSPLRQRTNRADVRHLTARLTIDRIEATADAKGAYAVANALRRTLERGAASLSPRDRTLFTGFVYGDDRGQSTAVADDFRATGLGHLLAVSGENVAFAVSVFTPLLRRLTFRPRFALLVLVLAQFAVITRFEPSVLRATFMYAASALAATTGHRATGRRTLSLAVSALILIDPIIVYSLGFQLSVLATAGIVEFSPAIAARLKGPSIITTPLSLTLAAQVAVLPIELLRFGGVPIASLPANVLAAPFAAPVMVWGLTGGLLAGLIGDPLAALLHLPTRVCLGWVAFTARSLSRLHLGELREPQVIALAAAVLALTRWPQLRRIVLPATAVALLAGWHTATPATEARGVEIIADGSYTVVRLEPSASESRALEMVRRRSVDRIDLLLVTEGDRGDADVVYALRQRLTIAEVWAPADHRVRGAVTPQPFSQYVTPDVVIETGDVSRQLQVRVWRVASPP